VAFRFEIEGEASTNINFDENLSKVTLDLTGVGGFADTIAARAAGQVDLNPTTGAVVGVEASPTFGFDVLVGGLADPFCPLLNRHVGVVEFDLRSLPAGLNLEAALLTVHVKTGGGTAASTLNVFRLAAEGDGVIAGSDATGSATLAAQLVSPAAFSYSAGDAFAFDVRAVVQVALDAGFSTVAFRFEIEGEALTNITFDADLSKVTLDLTAVGLPELVVNPINQGPIHLEADGRFCTDVTVPCATEFSGNDSATPIPGDFEWRGFVPLAFVPGPDGATATTLSDHSARSFVYSGVDNEGGGLLNLYLMYDYLHRIEPFGPDDHPSVTFDVGAGRFAGRMEVSLHCTENRVLVTGFDDGIPFTDRDGVLLGIEGGCGFGKSPNPTGDPFFDVFVDGDGLSRGFNVPHAMFELGVPLTEKLGGDPRPGGGVYDPSPAFWSAAAPGSGTLVLSRNTVSINTTDGSSSVAPIAPLTLKRGTLALNPKADGDKITLQAAFAPPAGPAIDPPGEGLTAKLSDANGLVASVTIQPGSRGWKTLKGPKWTFKDKTDGSFGDPDTNEMLSIQFNKRTEQFDVTVSVTKADVLDSDAGQIITTLFIGARAFTSTNTWRPAAKGGKLITP
jgi:hypothetical protein